MRTLVLFALVVSGPAMAQKIWTPAPVPTVSDARVTPADRAGGPGAANSAGPVNATPFSAAPPELQSGGGSNSENRDGSPATPAGQAGHVVTPSLSR